jgi:hypothetical protein
MRGLGRDWLQRGRGGTRSLGLSDGWQGRIAWEEMSLETSGRGAQEAKPLLGTEGQGMFVEDGLDAAATLGWEATEEDFQPGEEQVFGNEGQELGEGDLEGDECLDGVAGAGMDGGDGALEVSGKSLRVGGELLGKVAKAGGPEGMGVVAGLEGIEVAGGRAAATGAELGVAMGAAMGVAAHGPVAAAGHLTAGFVGISGHFRSLGRHYSTNVLFCQMGLRAWRYPLLCKDH